MIIPDYIATIVLYNNSLETEVSLKLFLAACKVCAPSSGEL